MEHINGMSRTSLDTENGQLASRVRYMSSNIESLRGKIEKVEGK